MIPLYTRFILPNELGLFSLTQSLCAFFIVLFSFGLDDSVLFFSHKFKFDLNLKKKYLGNVVILSLSISFLGAVFLFVFRKYIFNSSINGIDENLIYFALVLVASSPIFNIYQKYLRIESKALNHALMLGIYSLVQMCFIMFFVVLFKMQAYGMLISFSVTSFIFGIYSLYKLRSHMIILIDKSVFLPIINYSKYIFTNGITSWGITNLMILSLGKFSSSYQVGIYTAISFFGIIFLEISKIFLNIFQPYVYDNIENNESTFTVEDVTKVIVNCLLILGLGMTYFNNFFFELLIDSKYAEGINFIPYIICLGILNFHILMLDQISGFYKRSAKYFSIASVLGLALNLVLIYIFKKSLELKNALLILIFVSSFLLFFKTHFLNITLNGAFRLFKTWIISFLLFTPFFFKPILCVALNLKLLFFTVSILIVILSERKIFYRLLTFKSVK
jgi:O-antigen/teichoic acid export membrane protein